MMLGSAARADLISSVLKPKDWRTWNEYSIAFGLHEISLGYWVSMAKLLRWENPAAIKFWIAWFSWGVRRGFELVWLNFSLGLWHQQIGWKYFRLCLPGWRWLANALNKFRSIFHLQCHFSNISRKIFKYHKQLLQGIYKGYYISLMTNFTWI